MTNEEALKEAKRNLCSMKTFKSMKAMFEYYHTVIEALEKQMPKRVLAPGKKEFTNDDFNGVRGTSYYCPGCKKRTSNANKFCKNCGQALLFPTFKWSPYKEGEKQISYMHWSDEQ